MTDFSGANFTISEWEKRLGDAMRQLRITAGFDQNELADRANVSRSTVQSLEQGSGTRLHTLLAVLRALDRLDVFDSLMPSAGPTPLEQLAMARRAPAPQRRRKAQG
ncbi:MAG TPA: helix-turn-helix domain-containing protein [Terrimesophilobacter sp.]|nr:helix-turn-helix domain-containing protein [Terrimesophilobacter sp.]HRP99007.1 helix-turn-helix domain-containing protein [Terrimesophilobacter sp.]